MNITIFLSFPIIEKIVKKTWDLTQAPITKGSCPFLKNIRLHGQEHTFLNYPHTGDLHVLEICKDSPYRILFVSRRTMSSEISIWGEVEQIYKSEKVHLQSDQPILDQLLENGWEETTPNEQVYWKKFKGL